MDCVCVCEALVAKCNAFRLLVNVRKGCVCFDRTLLSFRLLRGVEGNINGIFPVSHAITHQFHWHMHVERKCVLKTNISTSLIECGQRKPLCVFQHC